MTTVRDTIDALAKGKRHRCPTCDTSQGLKDARKALDLIDAATDAWLEQSGEWEMEAAYYRDALQAIASHRVPCRRCGKPHEPWEKEAPPKAMTWESKDDGHPYDSVSDQKYAASVLGELGTP